MNALKSRYLKAAASIILAGTIFFPQAVSAGNNFSEQIQCGYNNSAYQQQSGRDNITEIIQNGYGNSAHQEQRDNGCDNYGNAAWITQSSLEGQYNTACQHQDGNSIGNTASIIQNGDNHAADYSAVQYQYGDNNNASIEQSAYNNYAFSYQEGSGNSIIQIQNTPNNTSIVYQYGTGNIVKIVQ